MKTLTETGTKKRKGPRLGTRMMPEAKEANRRQAHTYLPGDLVIVDKSDSWGWKDKAVIVEPPQYCHGLWFRRPGSKDVFAATLDEITMDKEREIPL